MPDMFLLLNKSSSVVFIHYTFIKNIIDYKVINNRYLQLCCKMLKMLKFLSLKPYLNSYSTVRIFVDYGRR
jgi:hypothetical protein